MTVTLHSALSPFLPPYVLYEQYALTVQPQAKGTTFKTEMMRNFFSQGMVNLWNSLSQKAVETRSLSVFKTEIDGFLINKRIRGYGGKDKRMGMRQISAMIEWRSRLNGPSGLILLLCLMV